MKQKQSKFSDIKFYKLNLSFLSFSISKLLLYPPSYLKTRKCLVKSAKVFVYLVFKCSYQMQIIIKTVSHTCGAYRLCNEPKLYHTGIALSNTSGRNYVWYNPSFLHFNDLLSRSVDTFVLVNIKYIVLET